MNNQADAALVNQLIETAPNGATITLSHNVDRGLFRVTWDNEVGDLVVIERVASTESIDAALEDAIKQAKR